MYSICKEDDSPANRKSGTRLAQGYATKNHCVTKVNSNRHSDLKMPNFGRNIFQIKIVIELTFCKKSVKMMDILWGKIAIFGIHIPNIWQHLFTIWEQ